MINSTEPYSTQGFAAKQIQFWQFIHDKASAFVDVVLLYVLESKGSSPGRQGFKMAVCADGTFRGSIGGGIMEHKFVELARAKLHEKDAGHVYRQVHDKSAVNHQSGMICSGEQTIFLHVIRASDLPHIRSLIISLQENRQSALLLSVQGVQHSSDIPSTQYAYTMSGDHDFRMVEKIGYNNEVYIIGGGHCSLALSKLLYGMDFHITVIDDREGLSTMTENNFAHRKILVPSYASVANHVAEGNHVFVVIMTFGYRTDDQAFRSLMHHSFRYIGILGSRKKMDEMFTAYRSEGVDASLLSKVYSPVGIRIKSETPEEIAISIAAEMIDVKNRP